MRTEAEAVQRARRPPQAQRPVGLTPCSNCKHVLTSLATVFKRGLVTDVVMSAQLLLQREGVCDSLNLKCLVRAHSHAWWQRQLWRRRC
jgi:hypothetical protein